MYAQSYVRRNTVSTVVVFSCTSDLAILQAIIFGLQSLKSFPPVLSQVRLPIGSNSVNEESWHPLFVLLCPLGGLVALAFFNFLLKLGRFRVLLALYRTCDTSPETLRFIGKLLVDRGNNFGRREKGS